MSQSKAPKIDVWYRTVNDDVIQVVAIDEDEESIEVQFDDGTIEELDMESWAELETQETDPPDDWSDSFDLSDDDVDPDDLHFTSDPWENPLDDYS